MKKKQEIFIESKNPVLGVIGALALVIIVIAYSGTSIIDDTSGEVRIGNLLVECLH